MGETEELSHKNWPASDDSLALELKLTYARILAKNIMGDKQLFFPIGREITNSMEFEMGVYAASCGQLEQSNPHPKESIAGARWQAGYLNYVQKLNTVQGE